MKSIERRIVKLEDFRVGSSWREYIGRDVWYWPDWALEGYLLSKREGRDVGREEASHLAQAREFEGWLREVAA